MLTIARIMMKIEERNLTKMRSIFTLMLCGLVVFGLEAQKKPKLNVAERELKDGNYAAARDIVDQASEYEKLKDDPKTWFLRARVYMSLDTAGANLADDPIGTAMESFAKAQEIGDVTKLYTTDAIGLPVIFDQHINNYWAYYFNKGATAYGEEDFPTAVENFQYAQRILPDDSTAFTNAGLAAHNAQMWDEAATNYEGAIARGVTSQDIFNLYISVLTAEKKDYDKAVEVVRKAREIYTDDKDLARTEINLLIQMGKTDEAKANLERQLKEDPNNTNYHFIYGVLLEESGDQAGAVEAYRNAIKVDANNYNANFNLGVMLINEATEIIKERNNLGISDADLKKADELDPQIDAKLESALPQWEKVHELDPKDETAMSTLRYIYVQLKQNDKAEEMQNKIDAAGGGED